MFALQQRNNFRRNVRWCIAFVAERSIERSHFGGIERGFSGARGDIGHADMAVGQFPCQCLTEGLDRRLACTISNETGMTNAAED